MASGGLGRYKSAMRKLMSYLRSLFTPDTAWEPDLEADRVVMVRYVKGQRQIRPATRDEELDYLNRMAW